MRTLTNPLFIFVLQALAIMAAFNGNGSTESETLKENVELKSKIESLEAEIHELEVEMCKLRNDTSEDIKSQRTKIEKLKETIKSLQSEIKELKADLKQKEERIKSLEEKYQTDSERLYVSQLAFLFERAVCSYVLPEVFEGDRFATIKSLLNHLNGGVPLPPVKADKAKILSEGRKRWEEVCDKLQLPVQWKTKSGSWDIRDPNVPQILRAIGYLKKDRVTVAHPSPIKLSVAKEKVLSDSIKDKYKPYWQYEPIKNFICSPHTQEYLKKGNLDQKLIDFN